MIGRSWRRMNDDGVLIFQPRQLAGAAPAPGLHRGLSSWGGKMSDYRRGRYWGCVIQLCVFILMLGFFLYLWVADLVGQYGPAVWSWIVWVFNQVVGRLR